MCHQLLRKTALFRRPAKRPWLSIAVLPYRRSSVGFEHCRWHRSPIFAVITSVIVAMAGAALSGSGTATEPPAFTVLHEFPRFVFDPAEAAGLIQATDGSFYGTTRYYRTYVSDPSLGTVFKMTPAGDVTILHTFTGGTTDGRARAIRPCAD
jgi:hypothetical protein